MARGTYTLIPLTAYDSQVPQPLADKWAFTVDDENRLPQPYRPTWREAMGMGIENEYGVPRQVAYMGVDYMLLEFSLSGGLTDDIEALQATEPETVADYQLLTASEARSLLEGDDIFR